jgi:hypothetical protein
MHIWTGTSECAAYTSGLSCTGCAKIDLLTHRNNTYDKAVWTTTRSTKDSDICTRNHIADINIKPLASERRRRRKLPRPY